MTIRQTLVLGAAVVAVATVYAQNSPDVLQLDGQIRLTYREVEGAQSYSVEWAPAPQGPWRGIEAGCRGHHMLPSGAGSNRLDSLYDPARTSCFFRVIAGCVPPGTVRVPPGAYRMGNAIAGEAYVNELPRHRIALSHGLIFDAGEITWAHWRIVRDWSVNRGYDIESVGAGKGDDHPVHSVNWYDAVKWCNARSERDGRTPCYLRNGSVYRSGTQDDVVCNWSASGFRLPTEAEWEYAARGGAVGRRFSWSDTDTIQHARANYYKWPNSTTTYDTSPTSGHHNDWDTGDYPYTSTGGYFVANGYGLHDMTGNLSEWCWDWEDWRVCETCNGIGYIENAALCWQCGGTGFESMPCWSCWGEGCWECNWTGWVLTGCLNCHGDGMMDINCAACDGAGGVFFQYEESEEDDPPGPVSGSLRVVRGGSWTDSAYLARVACRNSTYPSSRCNWVGFRAVRLDGD